MDKKMNRDMEKIEIFAESLQDDVKVTLPACSDMTKALLCDAMSQSDEFLNCVCACVAGWFAFQPADVWEKVKKEMDLIRSQVAIKVMFDRSTQSHE